MFDPVSVLTLVVAVVAVLATGYAYFRSSAVKVWEQNADAYRARVELLESQNSILMQQVAALEARIHELDVLLGDRRPGPAPTRSARCECGAPLLWGSRFCANCGRPVPAPVDNAS